MLTEKMFYLGGMFLATWLMAKYSSPADYGNISVGLAAFSILSVFAGMGMSISLVHEISKLAVSKKVLIDSAASLIFLASILAYSLVLLTGFVISDSKLIVIVWIINLSLLVKFSDVIRLNYEATSDGSAIFKIDISIPLILLAVIGLGVYFQATNIWFALAFPIAYFTNALIRLSQPDFKIRLFSSKSRHYCKPLLEKSMPVMFADVAVATYMKNDLLIVAMFLGADLAANFSVAALVAEGWLFLPVIINSWARPKIYRAFEDNPEKFDTSFQNYLSFSTFSSVLIAAVISFFSFELINLLFGNKYPDAGGILRIAAWAPVFATVNNSSWTYYVVNNQTKLASIKMMIGVAIALVVSIFLIKTYGLIGAAWSLVFSRLLVGYLGNLFSKNTHKLFYMITKSFFGVGLYGNLRAFIK